MTETADASREPMTREDFVVCLSILLSEYESHPDNKDTFSLRMSFNDDGPLQHVWEDGKFELDYPDIPGDDN